jgi:ribonuclease HII
MRWPILIRERAVAWAVASATVEEIDRFNILHATPAGHAARRRRPIGQADRWRMIDGNRCPQLEMPSRSGNQGGQQDRLDRRCVHPGQNRA